jgi:hypothetical protein
MSEIKVECYAGYKGEQHPRRFRLGGQALEIREIEDQWYSPSSQYFRVRASDGNVYVLRHDQEREHWSLHAFRRSQESR